MLEDHPRKVEGIRLPRRQLDTRTPVRRRLLRAHKRCKRKCETLVRQELHLNKSQRRQRSACWTCTSLVHISLGVPPMIIAVWMEDWIWPPEPPPRSMPVRPDAPIPQCQIPNAQVNLVLRNHGQMLPPSRLLRPRGSRSCRHAEDPWDGPPAQQHPAAAGALGRRTLRPRRRS